MSYTFSTFHQQLDKLHAHVKKDIGTLRTGKASAQLLDEVLVDAYGAKMHVHELATISVADPTLLVISPWDKSVLGEIERAITAANLNLSAITDGTVVRVPVPALTQERRLEMVKLLHQKAETGRVMVRSLRSDAKRDIEDQKGETGVSEDDIERELEELEKLVTAGIAKVDEMVALKEKELTTI